MFYEVASRVLPTIDLNSSNFFGFPVTKMIDGLFDYI